MYISFLTLYKAYQFSILELTLRRSLGWTSPSATAPVGPTPASGGPLLPRATASPMPQDGRTPLATARPQGTTAAANCQQDKISCIFSSCLVVSFFHFPLKFHQHHIVGSTLAAPQSPQRRLLQGGREQAPRAHLLPQDHQGLHPELHCGAGAPAQRPRRQVRDRLGIPEGQTAG